jgi:hypothetical protein
MEELNMEKGTHTPGPWIIRDDGREYQCPIIESPNIGRGYWSSLATVTQRDKHPTEGGEISATTAMANARLIAAAPDLLEALEVMLSLSDPSIDEGFGAFMARDLAAQRKARAAIAKAVAP